jgi:hypothetical protein
MLETVSLHAQLEGRQLVEAIDASLACVQTCTACADACLQEDNVADLRECIRLDLDCADACGATARVLSRQTAIDPSLVQSLLSTCVAFCRMCAEECERHAAVHDHCRVCAEACRRCERACLDLLGSMPTA